MTDLVGYVALSTAGLPTMAAKAASYLAGVAVGFVLNKRWTFESARRSGPEAAAYLALYGVTLAINVVTNGAVLSYLGAGARLIAFLVATGLTTVLNYLGMRLVAFRGGVADRRGAAAGESNFRIDSPSSRVA